MANVTVLVEISFFLCHSMPFNLVGLTMDKDTELCSDEILNTASEFLNSVCLVARIEAAGEVTEPILRLNGEQSGLEETMSQSVSVPTDVPTQVMCLSIEGRNSISLEDNSEEELYIPQTSDPCEDIYEDLARLYMSEPEITIDQEIDEGRSSSRTIRRKNQRRRLPNNEMSTIFPLDASPPREKVPQDQTKTLAIAQVFSAELAQSTSMAATRDAQPLDRGDYLCPDLFRKKARKTKGSSRRVSQKEGRIIQDRLRDLGYLDEANLPSNVPMTFDSPPLDIPRPTYRTAAVQGRIHLKHAELLVDSGSSISVVGLEFAQKHLRRCKRTAYQGGSITVADNNSVRPLGIIYAEVEVGPSRLIIPFVVFPYLPVPVLLGTDWLTESGAITDWKLQRMSFHGSNKFVDCVTVHPFDVAGLHLLNTVIIAPQSGTWAEVSTGNKSSWSQLPKATVLTTIDSWTAEYRGITSPNAIAHTEYGRTKIFLVNTTTNSVRLNAGKSVAFACPGVPKESDIVPTPIQQYDMASPSKTRGEPIAEVEKRMDAAATFFGIQREAMDEEEVYVLRKAACMNINQWTSLRNEWKMETQVSAPPRNKSIVSTCVNFIRCMFIGNKKNEQGITQDNSAEIYTPKSLIQKVRHYYGGHIELDPASCSLANKVVRAHRYFSREENGLEQPWEANKIFINPPYGDMNLWTTKIIDESKSLYEMREKEIFVLVPVREAKWYEQLLPVATAALMPHKKTLFWTSDRERVSIRDPVTLLYFGPENRLAEIAAHFQDEYTIMRPLGTASIGSMWTPPKTSVRREEDEQDYDPVPSVKIGVGKELLSDQRSMIETLLRKYKHVVNPKPGVCRVAGARIDTGSAKPINLPLRRTSPAQRADLEKELKELQELGIIQPSVSPWAAAVVLVKKPDGSWRFCVDYRELNKVTIRDSYPLPRVDDYLHAVEGNIWFSIMDLTSGFFQIPIHPDDVKKTAFITHAGLYEFTRLPMGSKISPPVFQRVMDMAFAGMKWRNILVYVDDVLVMSPTFERHLEDLEEAFKRLENIGMTVKPSKCKFACGEIRYLGHLITEKGIRPNPEKVRAIKEMPWPDTAEKMASFLGLVSYYRAFIENCSTISEPLHILARLPESQYPKTPNKEADKAFTLLKEALIKEEAILVRPDFTKPFILQTDASNYGLSAILSQKDDEGRDKVIAYASRTLIKAERAWHTHELEALAVIWGCEHYRPYLIGQRFTVETDHQSLKWLMEQKKSGRLERWVLRLSEFEMEIKHRAGRHNGNADGPSRNPVPYRKEEEQALVKAAESVPLEAMSLYMSRLRLGKSKGEPKDDDLIGHQYLHNSLALAATMTVQTGHSFLFESKLFRKLFAEAQRKDDYCNRYIEALNDSSREDKPRDIKAFFVNNDGLLMKRAIWRKQMLMDNPEKALFVVPEAFRDDLLRLYHNLPHGGHLGGNKMASRLKLTYFWPRLGIDCKQYSRGCATCDSRKPPRPNQQGKMVLRPLAGPWERIAIDVLSGFNTSKQGNTLLLVVMDEFTKWPEVIPLRNQKAETIAEALVQHVFYRFGIPQVIHSDKATNLGLSHICKNVCDLLGISRSFSSAGHPEGNGQVERFNRFLVAGLYCLMNKKQNDWDTQLPGLLFAYRTSVHSTTGETPFFLNHGRDPVLPGDLLLRNLKTGEEKHKDYARNIMEQHQKIVTDVHKVMEKEREKMKRNHDRAKKKKDVEFHVEDASTLQPADLVSIYYQEPHVVGHSTKFRSTWSIPFRVIRKLDGGVNYEVQSTRDPRKKKVVHVSRMRLYKPWHRYMMAEPGQHIDLASELPGDTIEGDQPKRLLPNEDYEIDGIIDQYDEGKGKTKKTWYLVNWTGYQEPSWVLSHKVNAKEIVGEWKRYVKQLTRSEKALINVEPSQRPGKHQRVDFELADSGTDELPDEVADPIDEESEDNESEEEDSRPGHKDTSNRKRSRSFK
jgi:hypothetical protein